MRYICKTKNKIISFKTLGIQLKKHCNHKIEDIKARQSQKVKKKKKINLATWKIWVFQVATLLIMRFQKIISKNNIY